MNGADAPGTGAARGNDRAGGRPALRVVVQRMLRNPGVRHPVQRVAALGEELSVVGASVDAGAEVVVDLQLEATADSITAVGEVRAPFRSLCRRCAEPMQGELVGEVLEIFERRPTEGETYPLVDDAIELDDMVRDTLLLSLPLVPLCAADCAGPAPDQFPAVVAPDEAAGSVQAAVPDGGGPAEDAGDATDRPIDPRWAALSELRFDS
ncbi:MAG: DUF177 domain-containing protein [Acidimicrobiia bacterium]|nr:DUF177 domain-containing protein [Acidimicrobiia bacterium]